MAHFVCQEANIRSHLKTIAIAEDNLALGAKDLRSNCLGQLLPLVKDMAYSLLNAVQAIRNITGILHRDAGDITAGNADLSARIATQAAALEQTAASMEEITAIDSSENARDAQELAGPTVSPTQQGVKLV